MVTLSQSSQFIHSEGSDSSFGSSLESLDVDGDGHEELAVGAPGESPHEKGQVFLFGVLSSAYSAEDAYQVLSGTDFGELFGAVLSAGDLNGDGYSDLAVGSPEGNFSRGGVMLYSGSASGELEVWVELAGESGAFGSSLDATGDWSQDGVDDLLIGAPATWTEDSNGVVYLLQGRGL